MGTLDFDNEYYKASREIMAAVDDLIEKYKDRLGGEYKAAETVHGQAGFVMECIKRDGDVEFRRLVAGASVR